jgi:hypothetical protein
MQFYAGYGRINVSQFVPPAEAGFLRLHEILTPKKQVRQ